MNIAIVIAVLSGLLQITGYVVYNYKTQKGGITPNSASWAIWTFGSVMNLLSYARYVCTVRPYGKFVSDPAGGITEIKLIDPKDSKKYFDWGKIGERIINRATELLKDMK